MDNGLSERRCPTNEYLWCLQPSTSYLLQSGVPVEMGISSGRFQLYDFDW